MDIKLAVLIVIVTLGILVDFSLADFFYNRPSPSAEDLSFLKLKCVPGRTILKIEEKVVDMDVGNSNSEEYTRRMYTETDLDERCRICVCAADGINQFCFNRAGGSINECMMIYSKNEDSDPFQHLKSLSFRLRRDYLWHNDEIPYEPTSKCYRGHSYYTNHDTPNNTAIIEYEEVKSLLDFNSESSCFFCVCSVSGHEAGCISRNIWFCNYIRYLRSSQAQRDMYASMFKQDRPMYFSQLSYRIRRNMDDSVFEIIKGGDTLCCSHPDGHRRQMHSGVRNKLRTLRRRIPKENLLGGAMRGDYVDFIVNND